MQVHRVRVARKHVSDLDGVLRFAIRDRQGRRYTHAALKGGLGGLSPLAQGLFKLAVGDLVTLAGVADANGDISIRLLGICGRAPVS